jgi:hypothetical protein
MTVNIFVQLLKWVGVENCRYGKARGKSEESLGDFTFLYTVWFYCVHLLNNSRFIHFLGIYTPQGNKLSFCLEDVLKVAFRNFHHIVTPFSKGKGGNKKIQFPPLHKGRVRVG